VEVLRHVLRNRAFLMTHYKDFAHNPNGDSNEITWAMQEHDRHTASLYGDRMISTEAILGDLYAFSTCVRPDNLHLWEQYAQRGKGVAIGIDARGLYQWFGSMRGFGAQGYIGMTRMDYDQEAFQALCAQSVEGFAPFDWTSLERKIADGEIQQQPGENATELLKTHVPYYSEYCEQRTQVLGYVALQKWNDFRHEEETRIIHHPLVHKPLPYDHIKRRDWQQKSRAFLPIAFEGHHVLPELVTTQHGPTPSELAALLKEERFSGVAVRQLAI
jgi:hypothetical protein